MKPSFRNRSQTERQDFVLAQIAIVVGVGAFVFAYFVFQLRAEDFLYIACVLLVVLYLWSLWSWHNITGTLFDPYVLFLTAAMLFNGGQALLETLHLNRHGILNGEFSSDIVLQTLLSVALGLAGLHLGALLAARRQSVTVPHIVDAERPSLANVRLVGWGLLAFSFIPALSVLRNSINVVMSAGYIGLFQREAPTSFGAIPQVLASFIVPAALLLLAGSEKNRAILVVAVLVICSYSATQLFLGSRTNAAMPLIAFAWLWHRCVHPLPRTAIATGGAIFLIVVLPLVGAVRNSVGSERLSLSYFVDSFSLLESPAVATIAEMGGSMKTVAYTIVLVPNYRPFDVGLSYLYALLTVVPNVFGGVHPTVARGLAGQWLVQTVAPQVASQGGGLGFSFVAEAYLNFGRYGVPLVLGFIGFLLTRFSLWAQASKQPARIATVASFLAFFLFFARSESATIVRPLIWHALLPYVLMLLVSKVGKSKRTWA